MVPSRRISRVPGRAKATGLRPQQTSVSSPRIPQPRSRHALTALKPRSIRFSVVSVVGLKFGVVGSMVAGRWWDDTEPLSGRQCDSGRHASRSERHRA